MKRLVVTGLACPPETWTKFLGSEKGQRIIPLYEVFENTPSADLREMSRYITKQIEDFSPDSIIAHDLGVPLTLISLLRLKNRGMPLKAKITLFNGAFRNFNVLRATHPFRVQWLSLRKAIREIETHGGQVDLRLKKHIAKIRSMYRYIILYVLKERAGHWLGIDELLGFPSKLCFKNNIQIIASASDPYIPKESLAQLKDDCAPKRYFELDYGHFPYSKPSSEILPLIREFEGMPV